MYACNSHEDRSKLVDPPPRGLDHMGGKLFRPQDLTNVRWSPSEVAVTHVFRPMRSADVMLGWQSAIHDYNTVYL